jgi:DNA-binding NarL/FixJ family response regulator
MKQREKALIADLSHLNDPNDIEAEITTSDLLDWLSQQLNKLTSAEKAVIELYLEGKTYAQIAELRGSSIKTIRSLRFTAVQKLKGLSIEAVIIFFLFTIFRNAENQSIESFFQDVVKKISEKELFLIDEI